MSDKEKINFYIFKNHKQRLEKNADGRTVSYMINRAIEEYLDKNYPEPKE